MEKFIITTIYETLLEEYDHLRPSGCLNILIRGKRKGFLCGKKVVSEKNHYCKKHSGIIFAHNVPDIVQLEYKNEPEIINVYETADGHLVDDEGTILDIELNK